MWNVSIMKKYLFLLSTLLLVPSFANAKDGTYDAIVEANGVKYSATVEVEEGEVTKVNLPKGGDMSVSGAEIQDIEGMEANGYNSDGESVHITLENYSNESEKVEGSQEEIEDKTEDKAEDKAEEVEE
jgi:hypothetical protein